MTFTAFHIYFNSSLVKGDMKEILFTHERQEDLCLSGLFRNCSLDNTHFVNIQVRKGILWSNGFLCFFCTDNSGRVAIRVGQPFLLVV